MADHVREHQSLLAAAEKRLLIRMAGRMPASIHSDHLTVLALAAMGLAGAGFWLARWDDAWLWVVVVALALNWFGDSLDGTLARVRGVERPRYGFYVDHVIDIVGLTFLLTGLACSGFMTPVIALSLLVAYLLVSGEAFLATAARSVFRMSFAGVGPTELRIILAAGAIALRSDPEVSLGVLGRVPLFDVGGVVATAGLMIALAVAVGRNTMALARLEPRPSSGALRKTAHGSTIPVLQVQGNSSPWGYLTSTSRRRSEARSSFAARGPTTSRTLM
jgi:phosphatidylglycerophosphate synthase